MTLHQEAAAAPCIRVRTPDLSPLMTVGCEGSDRKHPECVLDAISKPKCERCDGKGACGPEYDEQGRLTAHRYTCPPCLGTGYRVRLILDSEAAQEAKRLADELRPLVEAWRAEMEPKARSLSTAPFVALTDFIFHNADAILSTLHEKGQAE